MKKVMITGWAGFIGTNLVRMILDEMPEWQIHAADAHTYAARPRWAFPLAAPGEAPSRFQRFIDYPKLDISQSNLTIQAIDEIKPDLIIHLAAESHVCRSIESPRKFLRTNVVGTFNLLEACRTLRYKGVFHHVSTDEVFGDLGTCGIEIPGVRERNRFRESSAYDPRSPYSASKAASDHFVQSYHHTFGLDTRITNCSNNFGPNQHEEKLIPKTILAALQGKPITLYGPGTQVRDWIWVDDHCRGILAAIENGKPGGRYLLGGEKELTNKSVVADVLQAITLLYLHEGRHCPPRPEVIHTSDRPTDDLRYAIDCSAAKAQLAWAPIPELYPHRLMETVRWYRDRMFDGA